MEAARANWSDDRLDEFANRMDERFDHVDERFDRVDERFDRVDERFERVDQRFEHVDERFDRVDERFVEADRRTAELAADCNRRFGEVISRIDDQGRRLDRMAESLGSVRNTFVFGIVTLTGAMIAGFAAMIALFATQF